MLKPKFNLDRTLSTTSDAFTDLVNIYNSHTHERTTSGLGLQYAGGLPSKSIVSPTNLEHDPCFATPRDLENILTRMRYSSTDLKSLVQILAPSTPAIVYIVDVKANGAYQIRLDNVLDLNTVSNPTLNLERGKAYMFKLSAAARELGFKLNIAGKVLDLKVDSSRAAVSFYAGYSTPNVLEYGSVNSKYFNGQILVTGGEPVSSSQINVVLNEGGLLAFAPTHTAVVSLSNIAVNQIVNWRVAIEAENPKLPAGAFVQLQYTVNALAAQPLSRLISLTAAQGGVSISSLAPRWLPPNAKVYCAVYELTANVTLHQTILQAFKA